MISRRRDVLLNALKLFDLAVVVLAFGLATVPTSGVGHTISVADFFSMRVKVGNFFIFLGLIILWHALFSMCGLYASRRLSGRMAEVADIVKATLLGTLCLAGVSLLFHIRMATPAFVVVFWGLSTLMLICSRLMLRAVLAQTRLHGRNLRHMLIVGSNARAVQFADKIQAPARTWLPSNRIRRPTMGWNRSSQRKGLLSGLQPGQPSRVSPEECRGRGRDCFADTVIPRRRLSNRRSL